MALARRAHNSGCTIFGTRTPAPFASLPAKLPESPSRTNSSNHRPFSAEFLRHRTCNSLRRHQRAINSSPKACARVLSPTFPRPSVFANGVLQFRHFPATCVVRSAPGEALSHVFNCSFSLAPRTPQLTPLLLSRLRLLNLLRYLAYLLLNSHSS